MSITVIKEGDVLRVIDSSDPIPDGSRLLLYTESELEQMAARRIWKEIPKESQDDMMFQSQSSSYKEWMDDDVWDRSVTQENPPPGLSMNDFKP